VFCEKTFQLNSKYAIISNNEHPVEPEIAPKKDGVDLKPFSDKELHELLDDIESDIVERKSSWKGDVPNKARQAICAFANDLPGHNKPSVLFVGAYDDGSPSHEPITDELLRTLSDIRTDGKTLPLPAMTVEKRNLKGAEVAVVTVVPSDMPPVKYDGRIWIRTGPRRAIANEQEERILIEKRRYKNLPFDLYPVSSADISDLSRAIFEDEYLPEAFAPDILATNNRTYEERLSSCSMIVSPSVTTPTCHGLLSIGKNPQKHMPGAYIQFLRIDGTGLADDVIDEAKIDGAIAEMLSRTTDKLNAHNRRSVDVISGNTHKITSLYPIAALQQIVYNAVLHRTYEKTNAPIRIYWFNDRIEVISPGGPYGNVTTENFGLPGITDYRNPNLATTMRIFGLVQSFGRGIAIARDEMKRNGNPDIEFITDQNSILCIMRRNA